MENRGQTLREPVLQNSAKKRSRFEKTGDRPCAIGLGNACFVCVVDGPFDRRIDLDQDSTS
jgi:hypothetical protein